MPHHLAILFTLFVQVLIGWALTGNHDALGQTRSTTDTDTQSLKRDRLKPENRLAYVGVVSGCRSCHSPPQAADLPSSKNDKWVRYNEVDTWNKLDTHRQAYYVLFNERSIHMGQMLNTVVHRDKRCLACHCSVPHYDFTDDLLDTDRLLRKELAHDDSIRLKLEVGVNCEGCHGPAGNRRVGWLYAHQTPLEDLEKPEAWRYLDPYTKETKYGYWNVRSHVTRAQICASCHVGDAEQGRVLTHEMYAAGHPPLPGFELTTFVEQMPPHWQTFADKPDEVKQLFMSIMEKKEENNDVIKALLIDYRHNDLVKTKAMFIGALVSLAEHLRLTAQLIEGEVTAGERPNWPELAQFECSACHHGLRNPRWRQSRLSTAAAPGRPLIRGWTLALVGLAIETAERYGDTKSSDNRLDDVLHALQAQPFGDAEKLRATAEATSLWLTDVARGLELRSISAADGRLLRQRLVRLAARGVVDYDSARQYVWAFKVIDAELNDPIPGFARMRSKYADETNAMFRLRVRHDDKDPRPAVQLPTATPGSTYSREISEFDVAQRFDRLNLYDPSSTRRVFEKIDRLLAVE